MKKSIYTEKQRKLSDLLKRARENADMTQTELAQKLGKPQSFVAKYERGERRLDIIELLEITKLLKTDPQKILEKLV